MKQYENKCPFNYLKYITILYVEDDIGTKNMVELFLESKVQKLYSASDGKEGLELYKKYKPDLIITDIEMPNLNGIDMANSIREIDENASIIMLTAYNNSEYLFKAINMGISQYLSKPLDFRLLLNAIEKIAQNLNLKKENENIKNILEQYKEIVDDSSLVSKTDLDGKITYVNKRFEDVSGYKEDELLGKTYEFTRHPDESNDKFVEIFKNVMKTKKNWSGLVKNITKNGEVYFVYSTFKPILNLDGDVTEFITLRNDVTDLEKTKEYFKEQTNIKTTDLQEAIHMSLEYENAINESTIFVRIDTNKNFTYANELFYNTYGYTEDEIIGTKTTKLNNPEHNESFYQEIWNELESGNIWKGSLKTYTASKKEIYTDTTIVPLKNSKNEIVEYLCIIYNITSTVLLHKELEDTQRELLYRMGEIGETRSLETGNHVKRVAEYSRLIAQKIGLSKNDVDSLFMASPMHDIGKVGIPDAVLNKPGKLDAHEWKIMKTHAEIGYNILKSSSRPVLKAAAIVSYTHHEKWDGTGYPNALKEDNIHIFGRITAIADVFDALGSDRVYKKAWPLDKILDLFNEQRGKHFDPSLVDLFLNNLNDFLEIRDKYQDKV